MSKSYFLSYGEITKAYYLDYGCFDRNRTVLRMESDKYHPSERNLELTPEQLVEKLKEIIPPHRKSIIYGEIGLEDSLKKLLSDTFRNTCIKVQFTKDLASLCREKKTQKI